MNSRRKRQSEFKDAFYKACGNPIEEIKPVFYNGAFYLPEIRTKQEYTEVRYTNDEDEHAYHVLIGKDEYEPRRTTTKSRTKTKPLV